LHRITGFTVVYNSKHTHTITSETSRKGIIKIRAEINDIETKKNTIEQINETGSRLFEKINKTDKPLARRTEKRKDPSK